jgi:hypothetical protein
MLSEEENREDLEGANMKKKRTITRLEGKREKFWN